MEDGPRLNPSILLSHPQGPAFRPDGDAINGQTDRVNVWDD